MNIFKKAIKTTEELDNTLEATSTEPTPAEPTPPEEEWVWVEGYKGTDSNMCCREFQYELNKQFDMPEDANIEECTSGFHLCLNLHDVFGYYPIGNGHRFFKVKALVRKFHKDKCGSFTVSKYDIIKYDKLAAKSIIFISELTIDEVLKYTEVDNLPEKYKHLAIEHDPYYASDKYYIDILIEDGYSEAFATHIVKIKKFEIAHTFGSQKDLSMDVKVLGILYDTKEN